MLLCSFMLTARAGDVRGLQRDLYLSNDVTAIVEISNVT